MIHEGWVKQVVVVLLENIAHYETHDWKESDMLRQADVENWKQAIETANNKLEWDKDDGFDDSIEGV